MPLAATADVDGLQMNQKQQQVYCSLTKPLAADAEGHEFLRVLKQELAKVSAFFSAQEDELEV